MFFSRRAVLEHTWCLGSVPVLFDDTQTPVARTNGRCKLEIGTSANAVIQLYFSTYTTACTVHYGSCATGLLPHDAFRRVLMSGGRHAVTRVSRSESSACMTDDLNVCCYGLLLAGLLAACSHVHIRIASLDSTIEGTNCPHKHWRKPPQCRDCTSGSVFDCCLEDLSQRHPIYNIAACALSLCPLLPCPRHCDLPDHTTFQVHATQHMSCNI